MKRTHATRAQRRLLDTLLALPLERFRTAIGRLSPEELTALETRIETLIVGARFTRGGGHGMERHRAPIEIGMLERRRAEVRRLTERGPAPMQLFLVEPDDGGRDVDAPRLAEQAA